MPPAAKPPRRRTGEAIRPTDRAMSIEGGTAIVLTYLLVSIGVIFAFLGGVFMVGWFICRQRERRGSRGEE